MRVLGVDPGSRKTGWGVASRSDRTMRAVAAGVIRPPQRAPLADRLEVIYDQLAALCDTHRPDVIAVEDVFHAKYPSAAIKLSHVRGVVLLLAAKRAMPLAEYPPALVKRTVAGRGAAEKTQLARVVGAMLGMEELPGHDATDALAVALTHLHAHPHPRSRAPSRPPSKRAAR